MEPENNKFVCPTPNEINLHIGAQIRRLRKERNLSQGDLADALGLSYQQIHKYERGTNRVPVALLYRFAICFNVPIMAFYDGLETQAALNEPVQSASQPNVGSGEWGSDIHFFQRLPPSVRGPLKALIKTLAEKRSVQPAKPMRVARAREKV